MDSNLAAYAAYEAEKRRQAEQQQQNQPNLIDVLGKLALGTGAAVASYYGIQGLMQRSKIADPFSIGSYAPKPSQAPVNQAAVRRAAGTVPADVKRQQDGIELTRQARAERLPGVRQVDLTGQKTDLPLARTPGTFQQFSREASGITGADFLQQRLRGQATELPTSYYQRTPGTFAEFNREASGVAAAERLAQDPELLSLVKEQAAEELSEARSYQAKAQNEYRRLLSATAQEEVLDVLKKEANTVQAAAQSDFGPLKFIQDAGYVEADSLVDQHRSGLIGQVDHFANAANSAEDQATGRVKRAFQRNEDQNLAAIEIAEDNVDAQIASAAKNDPAVASVTELDAAINQVADGLPDGRPVDQAEALVTGPVSAQEMVEQAKQEMLKRRQAVMETGLKPGTIRFERALAQPFRTSTATRVIGTGEAQTALPAGPIRQTVQSVSASERLPENFVSNIGPQAVVKQTAAGTAIRGASPSYYETLPKKETRLLYGTAEQLVPGAPEEYGQDIPGRARVRGLFSSLEPQERSKQEIVYSVLDLPASQEIPGGSAGIGIYGIEPRYVPGAVSKATGEYSAASERRPTQTTFKERKTGFEGLSSEQLISAAEQAKSPRLRRAFEDEATRRTTTKSSLGVSEALRRARIEGRDPQSVLRSLGFEV